MMTSQPFILEETTVPGERIYFFKVLCFVSSGNIGPLWGYLWNENWPKISLYLEYLYIT